MQPTRIRIAPLLAVLLAACGSSSEPRPETYFAQPAPPLTATTLPVAEPTFDGATIEEATVEIRAVDMQRQTLQVARDGQVFEVLYDQNTVVFHQDQQWPLVSLIRGDSVVMEMLRTNDALRAGRIDVQDPARAGVAEPLDLMQLTGRVTQIDHDRGTFMLHTTTGSVHVALPAYPTVETRAAFHRLRIGIDVRLDATPAGTAHFEAYRFR